MTLQELAAVLRQALFALGVLFVIVDVKVGAQIVSWWRKRHQALVTWPGPKPPFFAINLTIGALLGVLLFVTAYVEISRLRRGLAAGPSMFGVVMMFVYYGYLVPLSTRIRYGLYDDGIWTDSGFMRYTDIANRDTSAGTDIAPDDQEAAPDIESVALAPVGLAPTSGGSILPD